MEPVPHQPARPQAGCGNAWGYILENRSYGPENSKYKFTGKERDKDLQNNYNYFGARYYDARIGRWGGVEPLHNNHIGYTPYGYCLNNPLLRIDVNGAWDIVVLVASNRSKNGYGTAIVNDRNGNQVFSFKVRVQGVGGRNRMKKNADTPLGVYKIDKENPWLTSTEENRESMGPNPRLNLVGESGEIKESGRTLIRIHGGRQEEFINGKWVPIKNAELKETHGCMRASDDDMKTLKSVTDELEKNDPEEHGEKVKVQEYHGEEMKPVTDDPDK